GASWAETWADHTHYFATIPSNQLETLLWMEADRLAAPFATVDSQRLARVKDVVRQERRSRLESVPFAVGASRDVAPAAIYPEGHPYHHGPGEVAALDYTALADAKRFCGRYYVPNNAVIALSGDFDGVATRRAITKYFGPIPRGANVRHRPAPAPVL